MLILPKSLTIAPIFSWGESRKMLLRSEVFPAPKKPETITTGIFRLCAAVFSAATWGAFLVKSSKISSPKIARSKSLSISLF